MVSMLETIRAVMEQVTIRTYDSSIPLRMVYVWFSVAESCVDFLVSATIRTYGLRMVVVSTSLPGKRNHT